MHPRLITIAAWAICACGADRTIYEDEGAAGNLTSVLDPNRDPADADDDPDPGSGRLQCPALPEDRPLMPGLSAGWAASQGGTTLLQFSTHPFSCGTAVDDAFAAAEACPQLWAFEISIDDALVAPGDVELAAEHKATLVQFRRGASGRGCARDTINSSSLGFRGTLRIHAVSEDCIVGEFIDLKFPTDDLTGLSGVFAAERC